MQNKVGILGAGAFGSALALVLEKTSKVSLFSGFPWHVEAMRQSRTNEFFKGFKIPETIDIGLSNEITSGYDYLFWVFPVGPTEELLKDLAPKLNGSNIVICSKGLLSNSKLLMDLFEETLPDSQVALLSGPNFAHELASGIWSRADLAARDFEVARRFAKDLSTKTLDLNPIDDVIGAGIAGALKNVFAIGAGIIKGLFEGQNASAAYLSAALSEMKTLIKLFGGKPETMDGLCGLGDLILTTSSLDSRNTSLGFEIAKGEALRDLIDRKGVCEGVGTLKQLSLAGINPPICRAIYAILFENQPASSIVDVFH